MGMDASTKITEEKVVVEVRGRIDISSSPQLRQELREATKAKPKRLIVDMSGLDSTDSSGLAVLIECAKRVRGYGGEMALEGVQPKVRDVLLLTRLDKIFSISGGGEK